MQTAGRLHNFTHLAWRKSKGSIFELLLHISLAKVSQISSLASRRAVRLGKSKLAKADATRLDLSLVLLEDLKSLLLGTSNLGLRWLC